MRVGVTGGVREIRRGMNYEADPGSRVGGTNKAQKVQQFITSMGRA